jgi:deoxyxylulose-5-phosphate synthase
MMLKKIRGPEDIKDLTIDELKTLAQEMREIVIILPLT